VWTRRASIPLSLVCALPFELPQCLYDVIEGPAVQQVVFTTVALETECASIWIKTLIAEVEEAFERFVAIS
jgi:hypothetical protein